MHGYLKKFYTRQCNRRCFERKNFKEERETLVFKKYEIQEK